jgi:hypothetical protein
LDSLEQGKHLEGIEISNSIMEFEKIAQNKYSKDSKKFNDRSGENISFSSGLRKIVDLLEKKGVRILSFYDAL